MKRIVLILSSCLLVLSSCKKKEYPENVSQNPEFYVSATIDGQPVMLKAGTLGYYMYSNYTQANDGMYSFIADVRPQNCTGNCANSLRFELNDNILASQGGASNINLSVKSGSYTYVNSNASNPTLMGYMVSFNSTFNLPSPTYDWYFGVGLNDVSANPTHTYAATGSYNTKLTASGTGSPSTASIENPVKVTTNPNVCRTRVAVTGCTNTAVHFTNVTVCSASTNLTYLWEFGDGSQPSPDATPIHVYPANGVYQVTLTTTDNQWSDTDVFHYNVNVGVPYEATPNFFVDKVNAIYSNSPLSRIKLIYTDGSGKVYTSDLQPQNGSSFNIVSVEDYKNNENNQRTKKLKITFNCRLYSGTNFVDITNGEAIIAVAYK